MIETRQLAALRAVAECGSVARAAESLAWSQPTVSHHLRGLARELSAPVVTASPGGTSLTAVGDAMLPHARAVLDRVARARDEVRRFAADQRRRIRLGVFPTVAARLLPDLVVGLQARGFTVTTREAEVDVLRGELADLRLDAAVLYTTDPDAHPTPAGFVTQHLFSESLVILLPATHPLARAKGVRLADLGGDDWVLGAQRDEPLEQLLTAAAQRAGFVPRAAARSDDYQVVAAYVAAGVGVALVPASAVPPPTGGVVGVALGDQTLQRHVELISHATLHPASLAALTAAITGVS